MIKLKEGQKVIAEDGSIYLVETGDIIQSNKLEEGLRIKTLNGDKLEILYAGSDKPFTEHMDIYIKNIPVRITQKKYIDADTKEPLDDWIIEYELSFDNEYVEKVISTQIKEQLEDASNEQLIAHGHKSMIGFTNQFGNYIS